MLDRETKRKIDSARDILVGKIPDPKAQVEQITISLIYKFMDDMDKESVEMGGSPTFFTGDFEQYGWSKIFDPRLGGFDMLMLYSEAIRKMNQNPNIPQLFRDIFKNAFLPYRDPQTLKLFLKQINEFHYDHSERLGDAFEYLLSVMSSQGDAGQFRTPRHIIDFMVQVVDPKKNETVCDPACGTAGFLISSYKHILKHNTKDRPGDTLTPDEKKRLINNFVGYDIASDMVQLSLVNMYLHGFSNPRIHEYDTLTSEDKWNETFDAVLANPPFMTPKGGICPHKRFSVQAKRSEVLFVAYIAEHLNPNGRAGVIVPEGIIFQSQNAYKQLRKMLVDTYLYAVVSLPAGVFNPYSGVKTSILLMDKNLSKKIDSILFVKIAHDGYDLGAQRKPIDNNDLPRALEAITNYKNAVNNDELFEDTQDAHAVLKSKIADNGEYNLSGDRYNKSKTQAIGNWPMIKLDRLCKLGRGFAFKSSDYINEGILNFRVTNIGQNGYPDLSNSKYLPLEFKEKYNQYLLYDDDFVIVMVGATTGKIGKITKGILPALLNQNMWRFFPNLHMIHKNFLYLLVKNLPLLKQGGARDYLKQSDFLQIEIPLPPLDIQKEIVAEIESYQKIVDGARQIVENWKPKITIDPTWPMVGLGEVTTEIKSGFAYGKSDFNTDGIPHLRPMNIDIYGNLVWKGTKYISQEVFANKTEYVLRKGDVLFNNTNSKELVGKTCLVNEEINCGYSNHLTRIRIKKDIVNPYYLSKLLHYLWEKGVFLEKCNKWVGQAGINNTVLSKQIKIPLPPLEVQQEIVAEIEEERKHVESSQWLIEVNEDKIREKIDEVWNLNGELCCH